MAKFTGLPNEILLNVGSHLDKASDKLHLLMANRVTLRLKLAMLYESISLHHCYELCTYEEGSYEWYDYRERRQYKSNCSVERLASALDKDASGLTGPAIKSLRFILNDGNCMGDHELTRILPHLSSLKTLCIINEAVSITGRFSVAKLSGALQTVKGTIEDLTVCLGNSEDTVDGTPIGDLSDFSKLKKLCIQSEILIGDDAYGQQSTLPPSQILPLGLERFTLHCCAQSTLHDQDVDIVGHYEKVTYGRSDNKDLPLPTVTWPDSARRINTFSMLGIWVPYVGTIPRLFDWVEYCFMPGSRARIETRTMKFSMDLNNVDMDMLMDDFVKMHGD